MFCTECGANNETGARFCVQCGHALIESNTLTVSQDKPASKTDFFSRQDVPGYAQICGIIALILAIVGTVIPVVGVLFITPLAIIFCVVALYGGYKGIGIATLIVIVINLLISPTFWANIGAGATFEKASTNRFLTYFDIIGVIAMFLMVIKKRKR